MFNLLRNIIAQPWAIDPSYIDGIVPFLTRFFNGENPEWVFASASPGDGSIAMIDAAGNSSNATGGIQPGSIAVVSLRGPMMKNDQSCGPSGTATLGRNLQELANNPNVDGIIMKIDSPGGTVDGTENLARIFGGIKKPKVAYVDGMMASAAMWVGSNADKIILNGETAMAGSIGTMSSFADMRPVLEKAGVKFHNIRATRSVHKNAAIEKATSESDYTEYRSSTLDPLNNVFTSAIEKNRAGKIDLAKEDVLTGKVYIGKAAVKAGLADSIGNFDSAIKAVQLLIQDKKPKKTGMLLKDKYPKTSAVAGFETGAEALGDGSVPMTAKEMEAVETALAAQAQGVDTATHEAVQTALTTAQAKITDLATEVADWKEKAEALGAITDEPENTGKKITADPGAKNKIKRRDSFAAYADEMLGLK